MNGLTMQSRGVVWLYVLLCLFPHGIAAFAFSPFSRCLYWSDFLCWMGPRSLLAASVLAVILVLAGFKLREILRGKRQSSLLVSLMAISQTPFVLWAGVLFLGGLSPQLLSSGW